MDEPRSERVGPLLRRPRLGVRCPRAGSAGRPAGVFWGRARRGSAFLPVELPEVVSLRPVGDRENTGRASADSSDLGERGSRPAGTAAPSGLPAVGAAPPPLTEGLEGLRSGAFVSASAAQSRGGPRLHSLFHKRTNEAEREILW